MAKSNFFCRLSRYRCVGCAYSPRSLTDVSSRGFLSLPPSCNAKYSEKGIITGAVLHPFF
ncbi:hypothetical protein DOX53_11570 [Cronobacter malonaticus]|uniref:Uncharacterized protein n=1 Tax=Cronobacter malonaticus TaxID=413503 RepID=A0A423Y4T5_9ENTR|nr:hypothetical protein [Cronobacter malonaticus]EGT4287930.1 hypothetical protein [Cronobacter malonaticus]EGT4295671.1 hypothetical protein [Cronobacter malonaticus]EGT4311897.1 hypothetical protein [Cronobacter malonaticus]EGT4336535.1 hypothetical protein [Cronobacter malonaticus]